MQQSDIFSFNGFTNKDKSELENEHTKDKEGDIKYEEIESLDVEILNNE